MKKIFLVALLVCHALNAVADVQMQKQLHERVVNIWEMSVNIEEAKMMTHDEIYTEFQNMKGH